MLRCLGPDCGEEFDLQTSKPLPIVPGLNKETIASISRVVHKGRAPRHVVDMPTLLAEREARKGTT